MAKRWYRRNLLNAAGDVARVAINAVSDDPRAFTDVDYRYRKKSNNTRHPAVYPIPFIESKKRVLSNAGLATGAVISENMLDSIAKYANAAGLPVKTALGLAVKESTLGNPTDDRTAWILNSRLRGLGLGQHINQGNAVNPTELVNFYKDELDPYQVAIDYALRKSGGDNDEYRRLLEQGERYADRQAKKYVEEYGNNNRLYNAFRSYRNNPTKYNPGQGNYQQLVNKRAEEVWNSPEIQDWYKRSLEDAGRTERKSGGSIHIAPSKRGTFTAAATKHGMGVQAFASKVLANKEDYSPAMVKKANFARNASKWH